MNKLLITVLAASALVGGCASAPTPTFVQGAYFLTGDKDCVRFRRAAGELECATKSLEITGSRRALTADELAAYQARAAANQQAIREITASLNGISAQIQNNTQQTLNAAASLQALEVQEIRQPNGTTWVYCRAATQQLYHCRTY